MDDNTHVNFDHPANAGILGYLGSSERLKNSVSVARQNPSCSPRSVDDPYMKLGTHPDLVEWLWDKVTVKLPIKCRWIVYGTPVLVNPRSGIIFGFAGGTHTYAFRLPTPERQTALEAGAKQVWYYPAYPELKIEASILDLNTIGKEWLFGGWFKGEEEWCLAAFNFANEVVTDTRNTTT
jgi:hypothetical protein